MRKAARLAHLLDPALSQQALNQIQIQISAEARVVGRLQVHRIVEARLTRRILPVLAVDPLANRRFLACPTQEAAQAILPIALAISGLLPMLQVEAT